MIQLQVKYLLTAKMSKNYNVKEYRKLYGTAFQDYQIFSMSVSENVLRESKDKADEDKVINALRKVGYMKRS